MHVDVAAARGAVSTEQLAAAMRLRDAEQARREAIEVPREVLEHHYAHGTRTSWTKRLESDPGVVRVPREELERSTAL